MSRYNRTHVAPEPVERRTARVAGSKYRRIQPYRDVFIAELHSEDVRSDGGPLVVLDCGVGVHVGYYIVDEFGDTLHPINAYFTSPVIACAAADILIDTPKKFDAKVSALLRVERDFTREF